MLGNARVLGIEFGAKGGAMQGAHIVTMPERRSILPLVVVAALSGCAVGPDYHPTPAPAPTRWQAVADTALSTLATTPSSDDVEALAHWWTWFEDDGLNTLIDIALAQNLDVRAASARVRAANDVPPRRGSARRSAWALAVNACRTRCRGLRRA